MNKDVPFVPRDKARALPLCYLLVAVVCCSAASAQGISAQSTSNSTQGTFAQGTSSQDVSSRNDSSATDPDTPSDDNQADQDKDPQTSTRAGSRKRQTGAYLPPPVPIRTTNEQAVDAGLRPTVGNELGGAEIGSGIVSGFPGVSSYGGQAAAAAAASPKFLSVYATQAISYSDNPGQISPGQTFLGSTFLGLNRPDFYEVTSGGILLSKTISRQNIFASVNFGVTNYAHDTNFNNTQYSLSLGDNYVIGDSCSGTIVANQSVSAVPLEFTIASTSTQNSENTSGALSARCRFYKNLFVTGGITASRNSFTNTLVLGNNSNQLNGNLGVEYAVPSFVTAGLLASVQETSFTGRAGFIGIANKTSQTNFNIYINKPITPKLNVALSGGIAILSTGSPSLDGSVQPVFSASASYAYSPKTSVSISYARATGSPQSFVADFITIETISASLSYRFSPKVSISAGASRSSTTSSSGATDFNGLAGVAAANLALFAANTTTTNEQISANYAFATNASASLAYQHTQRDSAFLFGPATANIVSLSLSYRH